MKTELNFLLFFARSKYKKSSCWNCMQCEKGHTMYLNSLWELFWFKGETRIPSPWLWLPCPLEYNLCFPFSLCLYAKIDCLFEADELLLFELVNVTAWLGTFDENLLTSLYIFYWQRTDVRMQWRFKPVPHTCGTQRLTIWQWRYCEIHVCTLLQQFLTFNITLGLQITAIL